jgi:hypothetical protein
MKLKYRIGLTIIDKLLLAGALFLVTLDVTAGLTAIGWDALSIVLGVTLAYLGVVAFVAIVTFFFRTEGKGVGFVKGLVSALLIWLLFPKVLGILFWLVGSSVSANVENVLLWTFVIRAGVGAYLGHRWKTVGD